MEEISRVISWVYDVHFIHLRKVDNSMLIVVFNNIILLLDFIFVAINTHLRQLQHFSTSFMNHHTPMVFIKTSLKYPCHVYLRNLFTICVCMYLTSSHLGRPLIKLMINNSIPAIFFKSFICSQSAHFCLYF